MRVGDNACSVYGMSHTPLPTTRLRQLPSAPLPSAASRVLVAVHEVSDEVRAGFGRTAFVMRTLDKVSLSVCSGELVLLHGGVASGAVSLLAALAGHRMPPRGSRTMAHGVQVRRASISTAAAQGIVSGWTRATQPDHIPTLRRQKQAQTLAQPQPQVPTQPQVVYVLRVRAPKRLALPQSPDSPPAVPHDERRVWAAWANDLKRRGASVVVQFSESIENTATQAPDNTRAPYTRPTPLHARRHSVHESAVAHSAVAHSTVAHNTVANRLVRARPAPIGMRILTMSSGRIIKEEVSRDSTDPIHSMDIHSPGPAFQGPLVPVSKPAATMPEFRLYNTLTRRVEPFAPADGHTVRMYTCGPTVYNPAHLGNFRTFLFEDLLRRAIRLAGWQVQQVMNLTDVDDKIIRKAAEQGISITEVTAPFTKLFHSPKIEESVDENNSLLQ